tara:strand:- start:734 stop:958 length:225 start_codon:yes stop_codon:yes gene_type:complete
VKALSVIVKFDVLEQRTIGLLKENRLLNQKVQLLLKRLFGCKAGRRLMLLQALAVSTQSGAGRSTWTAGPPSSF